MAYFDSNLVLSHLRKEINDAYEYASELDNEGYISEYSRLRLAAVCDDLQDAIRNLDLAEKELER